MSIPVIFAGNSYSIPEDEETGWEDLTDFLVAVALNAAVVGATAFGVRTAVTTPQTLQSVDTIINMNVASASVVNLPAGIEKTVYGVFDISGAANTNPITVTPNGAETINGQSTYVVNSNNGGVLLQFNGTQWTVISEVADVFKTARRIQNNSTNTSFVEGSITANGSFAQATDGQSSSADFIGSNTIMFTVALSTGQSLMIHASFNSDKITCVSDQDGLFLDSDAGVGIYVSKSAADNTITVKNRMGGNRNIEIKALTNRLANVTAWA